MARLIVMRDLAAAMAAAGAGPVRDGASVTVIDLEIAALAATVPTDSSVWTMRLRYPDPPRVAWLARWRRAQRRRAGIAITQVVLRWSPARIDALVDGRFVAHLALTASGAIIDEPAPQDAAA